MNSSSRSHRCFASTRWSMVVQPPASTAATCTHQALTELVQRYWYPVYAYVRSCNHVPPIAQDITQSFLQHLLWHPGNDRVQGAHNHFRRYLLTQLDAFLSSDWRLSVGDDSLPALVSPPPDLEARYQRDCAPDVSPEATYQRSFALAVLRQAFKRLRCEAHDNGHLNMYQALEPLLADEPEPAVFEELARRLNSRPLALAFALKRLRQRFRELVDEELVDTITSMDDLVAEQQALHAALRDPEA